MTPRDQLQISDLEREKMRIIRDRNARRKLSQQLTPDLPVDSDVVQTRVKTQRVGNMLEGIIGALTFVANPFFDEVCDKWQELCGDCKGKPGRYRDGHLFIYVPSAPVLFSMRGKLSKIKKKLVTLPSAPKKLTVHLEIH